MYGMGGAIPEGGCLPCHTTAVVPRRSRPCIWGVSGGGVVFYIYMYHMSTIVDEAGRWSVLRREWINPSTGPVIGGPWLPGCSGTWPMLELQPLCSETSVYISYLRQATPFFFSRRARVPILNLRALFTTRPFRQPQLPSATNPGADSPGQGKTYTWTTRGELGIYSVPFGMLVWGRHATFPVMAVLYILLAHATGLIPGGACPLHGEAHR